MNRVNLKACPKHIGTYVKEVWVGDDGFGILTHDGDGIIVPIDRTGFSNEFREFIYQRTGEK